MANTYSMDDLLGFLEHAGERGLMPTATARALAVASRNVLGVLTDQEKKELGGQDLDAVIKRFNNKRAKDFNPSSLREYGRRVHRAIDLFLNWRADPANFTVKTRSTTSSRKKGKAAEITDQGETHSAFEPTTADRPGTYHSSLPVRPGVVVTLGNLPHDLTKAEANRLAEFIKMLAIEA
jgi:hypothetical protein